MRASILGSCVALMATCLAACSSAPVERQRVEFERLAESGLSVVSFDDSVQADLSAGSADSPPRGRFRFLGLEHEVVVFPGAADTPPYAVIDPGTPDEVRVDGAIRERVTSTWTGPHGETQFAEITGTVNLRAAADTDTKICAEVEASGTIGEIKYIRFSVAPLLGSVLLGGARRRFLIFAHDPSRPDALDPGRLTWAFDRDHSGEIDATPGSGDVFPAFDRVVAFSGSEVRLASVAPDFRSCEVEVRASTDVGPNMLAVGEPAPPIDEATLDGGHFRLADHLGSRVLLVFWASWCGPCRRELAELVARRRDADLRYLWIETVSIDDDPEKAKLFAAEVKLPWPVVMSPAGGKKTVRTRYHVTAVPDAVLIDEEGRVVARHVLMKDMKNLLSRAAKNRTAAALPGGRPFGTGLISPELRAARRSRVSPATPAAGEAAPAVWTTTSLTTTADAPRRRVAAARRLPSRQAAGCGQAPRRRPAERSDRRDTASHHPLPRKRDRFSHSPAAAEDALLTDWYTATTRERLLATVCRRFAEALPGPRSERSRREARREAIYARWRNSDSSNGLEVAGDRPLETGIRFPHTTDPPPASPPKETIMFTVYHKYSLDEIAEVQFPRLRRCTEVLEDLIDCL